MTGAQPNHLRRTLKLRQLFSLSLGAIIGAGWIAMLGPWIGTAGPLGAMIAFALGALLMILIVLCYGELCGMYPTSGGEIVYNYAAFGSLGAFIVGWLSLLLYVVAMSFLAVSLGWMVSLLAPDFSGPVLYISFGFAVSLSDAGLGVFGVLCLAWLNARGARISAAFQDLATLLLVLVSLSFIASGFISGHAENLRPLLSAPGAGALTGIGSVLVTTPFWYSGFSIVTQALGERAEGVSPRSVAWAMVLSVIAAMAFYILLIASAALSLPRQDLLQLPMAAPAAFAAVLGWPWMSKVVLCAGILGVITSWNAIFFAGSRALYALARAHLMPEFLAKIDPRHGVPSSAIWMIGVLSAACTLLGRGAIERIVNVAGIAFGALFLSVCVSAIVLRCKSPRESRTFKIPGGMFVASLAALLSLSVLALAMWSVRPLDGQLPYEWIVLGGWCLVGGLVWRLIAARRATVSESERATLIEGRAENV